MNLNITNRAQVRAQQRGVRRETLEMVLELADRKVRLPGNAFAVSISSSKAAELVRSGLPAADVERTSNVTVVIAGASGQIITVEHRFRRLFH